MAEMKQVLRKEERVGRDSKRMYEATLSDYEKLQQDYQTMGEERDALKLANMDLEKEKQELGRKITEMEVQKSTASLQAEQYEVRIVELEARNSSLKVLLKAANEQKADLTLLTKHALMFRGKIYHIQVQIAEEVLKVKQVEARLE